MERTILGGGGALGALKFSSLLSSEICGHVVRYIINSISEKILQPEDANYRSSGLYRRTVWCSVTVCKGLTFGSH